MVGGGQGVFMCFCTCVLVRTSTVIVSKKRERVRAVFSPKFDLSLVCCWLTYLDLQRLYVQATPVSQKKENYDSLCCCASADLLRDSGSFLWRRAGDGELRQALQLFAKNTLLKV